MFRGKLDTTEDEIEREVRRSRDYQDAKEEEITGENGAVKRIYKKLQKVTINTFKNSI